MLRPKYAKPKLKNKVAHREKFKRARPGKVGSIRKQVWISNTNINIECNFNVFKTCLPRTKSGKKIYIFDIFKVAKTAAAIRRYLIRLGSVDRGHLTELARSGFGRKSGNSHQITPSRIRKGIIYFPPSVKTLQTLQWQGKNKLDEITFAEAIIGIEYLEFK